MKEKATVVINVFDNSYCDVYSFTQSERMHSEVEKLKLLVTTYNKIKDYL